LIESAYSSVDFLKRNGRTFSLKLGLYISFTFSREIMTWLKVTKTSNDNLVCQWPKAYTNFTVRCIGSKLEVGTNTCLDTLTRNFYTKILQQSYCLITQTADTTRREVCTETPNFQNFDLFCRTIVTFKTLFCHVLFVTTNFI